MGAKSFMAAGIAWLILGAVAMAGDEPAWLACPAYLGDGQDCLAPVGIATDPAWPPIFTEYESGSENLSIRMADPDAYLRASHAGTIAEAAEIADERFGPRPAGTNTGARFSWPIADNGAMRGRDTMSYWALGASPADQIWKRAAGQPAREGK